MIRLYISPSCTSCRKARKWLQEHDLKFVEKNIFHIPLSKDEIKEILSLTDEGTKEIISYRSKAYQNLDCDLDTLPMSELLDLFIEKPSLLRRPIIMDDLRLQIGYNDEEIRMFLPRKARNIELAELYDRIANIEERA